VRTPAPSDAAEATRYKIAVTERLLGLHRGEQIIVIGSDLPLLRAIARRLGIRLITGASSQPSRAEAFDAFRTGQIDAIAMSRIGTVGVDLPTASVLVQVSGTYGSRQEEAQRLGRILRPAAGKTATFYSIVLDTAREIRFAQRRQRFLVDQGYGYEIRPAADLPRVRDPVT
jgi:DNA excision repair protein ERCC-3